jgi:hypothetical protein
MTVFVSSLASGRALAPVLLVKHSVEGPNCSVSEALLSSLPSDWAIIPKQIPYMHWLDMRKILDHVDREWSRIADPTQFRVWILDCHFSRHSLEFLAEAASRGILVIQVPPNATEAVQPADQMINAVLAREFEKRLLKLNTKYTTKAPPLSSIINDTLWAAYHAATNPDVVKASWKQTGIHPLDVATLQSRLGVGNEDSKEETAALRVLRGMADFAIPTGAAGAITGVTSKQLAARQAKFDHRTGMLTISGEIAKCIEIFRSRKEKST